MLEATFGKRFCTPCTSAPVERVFSHGGLFLRAHRARMSNQLLYDLVLAKCNSTVSDNLCYLCCHYSIIGNAQRDAANFWFSLSFYCQTNPCIECNSFSLFQRFLVLLWQSSNPSCSVAINDVKGEIWQMVVNETNIYSIHD